MEATQAVVYARRERGPVHILPFTEVAPAWRALCGARVLQYATARRFAERPADGLCHKCVRHEAAGTREP